MYFKNLLAFNFLIKSFSKSLLLHKTQRLKNYADRFSAGEFWREIYVTRLWKRCKNASWLNLKVPSFVQKCPPEINIETNGRHFCRVNDAGCALYYRPAYPTLEVPYPKRMSWL